MEKTLTTYRQRIQSGAIDPVVRWEGGTSKTLFDPADPGTPLEFLGLTVWTLESRASELFTGEREYVLIPIYGEFEVAVGETVFSGCRPGGPFATQPELSNASAVYLGRHQTGRLSGRGEMIGFSGPAFADKPPGFIKPGRHKQDRRGAGGWQSEVITLVTSADISSTLTVGETYCAPGAGAGMTDPDDREAIHFYMVRVTEGPRGGFGVQLLLDDQGLDKAYRVQDRTAVAIPGGGHPAFAGPDTPMIFAWATMDVRTRGE